MKKFLACLSLVGLLMPQLSQAQTFGQRKTECYEQEYLFNVLMGAFQEVPVLIGNLDDGQEFSFWANDMGLFSFVITDKKGQSCLLGVGTDLFVPADFFPILQDRVVF